MRILFMGTPDIAAACLRALVQDGHTICGVYTRRDKPVGRKQILTAPPVKQVAQEYGFPVFQPATLRDGREDRNIRALAPEVIVVVAYGCILPASTLQIAPYGCINLHVSLLPRYRGSAPVQWAILRGETETGVSIIQMNEGVDEGDILLCRRLPIDSEETAGELFQRVTQLGACTLCDCVSQLPAKTLQPQPQDHAGATFAPMLNKEMAQFSFDRPAKELHDLVRGLNPWPVAYFLHAGKRIKVLRSRLADAGDAAPGTVLSLSPLTVACSAGALELLEVVPEGRKPMNGTAFAAGLRLKTGDTL